MTRITFIERVVLVSALSFIIFGLCAASALGQTPQATPQPGPPISPSQQDATRPPGTEQRQPIPEQARPTTADPTAPPGTQRPAPQAPPGTTIAPQTTPTTTDTIPATSDTLPTQTPTPSLPSNLDTGDITIGQDIREPVYPSTQPRPIPALPNLTRLGVTSDSTLALTLNDAIRRALENNNDIEVARSDVRFAETTLRALQGVYDPVFTFNPQINNLIQSQQSTLGGSNDSGTVTTTDITSNNSLNKFFSRGGGSYNFFFNNIRRTTNSRFNQLIPVYSASLGVTFTQPLLRDRSIDNNRRQIRIQRKRLEQSDADFRRRTIDVITQVQRAYWDLVFALRDQQNQLANLNLTRENLRRVEAQIAAGAVAPLERAEVMAELSRRESDVLLTTQSISV
ncbi:MAG TPA: TolC family protein, partial [Pyrinomonadaceae bacterium]|nr:TolC family protein [Pyrinomonadaceae bacterium]